MPTPEHIAPVERPITRELCLEVSEATLAAELILPQSPVGLVVFADGDGLSRASLRNRKLATPLHQAGLATLLVDLLTDDEQTRERSPNSNLRLLAYRLEGVTRAIAEPETGELSIGYFCASTGAAAALRAVVAVGEPVHSVVSLGGRLDLVGGDLAYVTAPTLLIAGSRDPQALESARAATKLLRGPHQMTVVDGAGRLFAEPGTLETAARLAAEWFAEHLTATVQPRPPSVNRTTSAASSGSTARA
jgi:putative phosphoribosyl transferase